LFNILCYLDDSIFQHIFKHQITDLILHNNDEYSDGIAWKIYITNVYTRIMVLFQNLQHLTIAASSVNDYPPWTLCFLQPTINFSSTLTVLCLNVWMFYDCLALLDGRLKQLNTFIVQVQYMDCAFVARHIDYPLSPNMVS
jgi:hypothetical protein